MKNFTIGSKISKVVHTTIPVFFICSVMFLIGNNIKLMAEGSPQFKPDTTKTSNLMIINASSPYGSFACFGASDTDKLYIRINDPATEKIYLGIGQRSTGSDWYYRIKNPNGTIIAGPTLLPTSAGQGFISYNKQAINGPNVVNAQGYNGFVATPTAGLPGNYYIEFNKGSGTVTSTNNELSLGIFDLTVVKTTTNTAIPGRLFSYNWSFNTNSYANPFFGSFYIYGSDSSVTKVDLNGIKPYKFRASCNSWGATSTGNSTNDRKSKPGFFVPPELKLFLRDPDLTAFPSGSLVFLNSPISLSRCTKDSISILVNLTKKSDVTILIDANGNGVYNPGTADRKLFYAGVPQGSNTLYWDGKNGLGAYVPVGSTIIAMVSVENGEVNFPMFDVENHETGFSMSVIRPGVGLFVDSLYFDDQLVGGSTNLNGCAFPCHTWASNPSNSASNTIGENNTLNTWWFAHKQSATINLIIPDYLITSAGADQSVCVTGSNLDTIQLSGSIAYSTSSYNGSKKWTTSGSGQFIPNDSSYNSKYIPSSGDILSGSLLFRFAPGINCFTPIDTVIVTLKKNPQLSVGITEVNCFGQPTGSINLNIANSNPPYTYIWSNGVTTQNNINITSGTYMVTVTSANTCTAAISATITQPASILSASAGSITPVSCYGGTNGVVTLNVSGGTVPYSYLWNTGSTTQNLSGVSAGNYNVTITDNKGCTKTASSITVSGPAAVLSSGISTTGNVSCNGGQNGTITMNISGGTPPYTFLWNNGSTTQNLTGLAAGSYTVTATDVNGCTTGSSSIVISQPASALSSNVTLTSSVSCYNGTNGGIDLTVSGGTSPYTYVWSNGSSVQDLTNIPSGSYTVTVTDSKGCSTVSSGIMVSQPPAALAASINAVTPVSCFGGNTGSLNLNVTGGTMPFSFNWSNGSTTQNNSNLQAGNYTVTITDGQGCTTSIAAIQINEPGSALGATVSLATDVSCFGGNNANIQLNITGGTSPYQYNWSNGASTQNINNITAGTYTVSVTDSKGCTTSVSGVQITQPQAALAVLPTMVTNVSCHGNSTGDIQLTVSGGTTPYTYNWSNGAISKDLNNITAGSYIVTLTDFNGCSLISSAIIVSQPPVALSGLATTTANVSCSSGANGAITLSVNGGTPGYTFNWSNGSTTQNASGLNAGNYLVTITDMNGCTANASANISQPAGSLNSTITTSQHVSCMNGNNGSINITVTGGTAPYTYQWNNGATTEDISLLSAGSYTVLITDQNGCINVSSASVNQPQAVLSTSITALSGVSCFGGNNGLVDLTVNGGTVPYSYNWSNGSVNEDQSGLAAGNYSVTVTDANGCTVTNHAISVTQPSAVLNGTLSTVTPASCFGSGNGSINLLVSGGTLPYTYDWSNGSSAQNINNLVTGNYSVVITDANGCQKSIAGIFVSQPANPLTSQTTSTTAVSCFGENNGTITLTATGGTTPYSFLWNTGSTTGSLANLVSGTYTVTVTDANGCTDVSGAITISQPAMSLNSSVSSTGHVSCYGGNNGSLNLQVTGGTIPYSYTWSNSATTRDLTGITAGLYAVTITDANGCTTQESGISITQPAVALNLAVTSTTPVNCFGGNNGNINLTVIGGTAPYLFAWSNGLTTQSANNLMAGAYTISVTDANGCSDEIPSIQVTQPSGSLTASVNATTQVSCFGGNNGAITLNIIGGTTPYSFIWSNGAMSQNLNNIQSGNYSVLITDQKGCTTTVSAISVEEPTASLTAAVSSTGEVPCFGGNNGSIQLSVSGGTGPYQFIWSNGATTGIISNLSSGLYTATITDANGCTDHVNGVYVSQPLAPVSAAASNIIPVSCFGELSGSVTLSVNGGTAPYSVLWSNGDNSMNLTNIASGSYTVTVTDNNGCTAIASSIMVSEPASGLQGTAATITNVSCSSGANGAISLTATGGTPGYSYLWSNGSTNKDISSLYAGQYQVTITDQNGCTATASSIVSQPAGSLNSSISFAQHVDCFGGNNGAIDLNITGGTPPYLYQWSNGATTEDISNLASGTYSVIINDNNGCINITAAVISQPGEALNSTVTSQSSVSCFGGNNGIIDLTINGGTAPYQITWSNGSNLEDQSGLSAGNYTVIITDAKGCLAVDSGITVSQPPQPLNGTITSSGQVSCYSGSNGSFTLAGSGGTPPYTYYWSNGTTMQHISNLSAGSYSVTITDQNGCTENLQGLIITQPVNQLAVSASITTPVSCFGGNSGSIILNSSGGTAPYTFIWNNGVTTENLNNLSAGTYTVTITDANGCSEIASGITVYQPAAALNSVVSSVNSVSCNSGSNGSLQLITSGGTQPYTYKWSNAATTQNIFNLMAGQYTVTVTDGMGCTTMNSGITINEPTEALNGNITATTQVFCHGGNNGAISLTVAGGTLPYAYVWSNGATQQSLSGLPSGTYSVLITDGNNCTTTLSGIAINQPAATLTGTVSSTVSVNCFGGNTGSVSLNVAGGTMPYLFSWSDGSTSQNLANIPSGTYNVTVTDANGCNTSVSGIAISQPTAALNANVLANQAVSCFGNNTGAISLAVNGGTSPYSFNWSNGAITQNLSQVSAGTYSVTISDSKGCSYTIAGQVVSQPPQALAGSVQSTAQVLCYGNNNGSIQLNISGGTQPYAFNWNTGAATQNISGLSQGNYSVTITDANGCTESIPGILISQPSAALIANAVTTQNVSCNSGANGTVQLNVTGGTGPYQYNWSNGAITQNITGLYSGTYAVNITDANGCTYNTSALVLQPAGALSSTINVAQQVDCYGNSTGSIQINPSGGTPPYVFIWNNGSTTQNISNLAAGVYAATITDGNGCINVASAVVSQPANPLNSGVSALSNIDCFGGSNGQVSLSVTGGTPPYQYLWNTGSILSGIAGQPAGTYTVTVTDINGCTNIVPGIIISQPNASLSANVSATGQVNCNGGNNGTINVNVSGGTSPYQFLWSNGSNTQNIGNLTAGLYDLTITDFNGCISNLSGMSVTEPPVALSATTDTIAGVSCYGGSNGAINLYVAGGTQPYIYLWSNGSSTQNIANLLPGNYNVTVTDTNGCITGISGISITQPQAVVSLTTTVVQMVDCYSGSNGSVDLTVSGGTPAYSFNWSNGATLEDLNNLGSGLYTVTVTDAYGCTQTGSARIYEPDTMISSFISVQQHVSCFAGQNGIALYSVIGGTPPYQFLWSNGTTTKQNYNLSAGTYMVTVTDANGCTMSDSVTVTQPVSALFVAATTLNDVSCFGGNNGAINLTVSNGTPPYSFNWSNGSTAEDQNALTAGTYQVTVLDANGCKYVTSASVTQPMGTLQAIVQVNQNISCFGNHDGSVNLTALNGTYPYSYLWNNGAITEDISNLPAGTYSVTVTDAKGCTSTASATITSPIATLSVNGNASSANCLNGITGLINTIPNGGTPPFNFIWNTGATTQNLGNLYTGSYTVTITDSKGCTASGNYIIDDLSVFIATGPSDICMGELATIKADSIAGVQYQWYMNGQPLNTNCTTTFITPTSGTYSVSVTNACGTFTSQPVQVTVHDVGNITTSSNQIICPGENAQLQVMGGISYSWSPPEGLNHTDIPNPLASPLQTTIYTVTVTGDFGCEKTATVEIGVICDTLKVPTGFSPNSDGINDGFTITGIDKYPGNRIWIYNRWGNLIYKKHDYANDWDGVSNVSGVLIGKKVPAGTYFFILDLNNNTKPIQGYIVMRY